MAKTEQDRAKDYLELFKITDKKYIIGVYESGITFYKQQIRALNIFDALKKAGTIPEDKKFTIAVIGGGIAGLTFAAAALKSKVRVCLFERGSQTLHIQAGCTIRDIHPNIYDWPSRNFAEEHTSLPVLDWKFGNADAVVKTVKKEFNRIVSVVKIGGADRFTEHLNVQDVNIFDQQSGKPFEIEGIIQSVKGTNRIGVMADLIIYAIGYGIEKGVSHADQPTESYWRNTSIKQDDLIKVNYLISGTGDGALIDLFTLLIRGFSYQSFLTILNSDPKSTHLMKQLVEIRKKRINNKIIKEDFYKTEFYDIPKEDYQYIIDSFDEKQLFSKLAPQVAVYLFGRQNRFNDILNYKRISMLNAFIAYLLYEAGKFHYGSEQDLKDLKCNGKEIASPYRIHHREGTDTAGGLVQAKFNKEETKQLLKIELLQRKSLAHGMIRPNWTQETFDAYFKEARRPSHELSKNTSAICSIFINMLGSSLADHYQFKKDIRVSMHRVLSMNGTLYYQMITPYFHNPKGPDDLRVGNIYPLRRGNVGYTIRTGSPLWVKNTNKDAFKLLMESFDIVKNYSTKRTPKTILTIPIMGKYTGIGPANMKSYNACNAVVYLDSTEIDFFDDKTIQNMILRLIQSFADTINMAVEKEDVQMGLINFIPVQPRITNSTDNDCIVDLQVFSELVPGRKARPLEFNQFWSLDM